MPDWSPAVEAAVLRLSGTLAAGGDSLLSYARLRRGWKDDSDAPSPSPLIAGIVPAVVLLYVICLKYSCQGPSPGFKHLRSKPPGAGKEGSNWAKEGGGKGTGVEVTWLGARELRVLEAFGDTLLPGFHICDKDGADEAVEQAVAMVRSALFRGNSCGKNNAAAKQVQAKQVQAKQAQARTETKTLSAGASSEKTRKQPKSQRPQRRGHDDPLPAKVEAYTRALARRSLEMHGRPGSDVGVAFLLAQAFESNISVEQRSGLQVLFWVLSTRPGAFFLTGRAVPFHAQSLAARHALLKRWSVSRIGKLREAFQGVKRLTCSLYFSAHPEVLSNYPLHAGISRGGGEKLTPIAKARIKTNPNWGDIRYDPQHHRLARDGNSSANASGTQHEHHNSSGAASATGVAKAGRWSGAKVKTSKTARAAAAAAVGHGASSPTRRPSTSRSNTNSNSNSNPFNDPPSPASSPFVPLFFSAAPTVSNATPKLFSRPRSKSNGHIASRPRSKSNGYNPVAAAAATAAAGPSLLPSPTAPRSNSSAAATAPAPAATPTTAGSAPNELPRELVVDVVVVGSGAGGGCAAGVLAARGLRVAVLEKGGLYGVEDYAGFSEMEAYKKLYEGQGVLATDDGGVVILAGSCVGGGTEVNWTASFRTPRHVRLEWARKLGLKSFEPGGPFDKALDVVCDRLGVNTDNSHRAPGCSVPHPSLSVNQHQSSLWNGAVASGRVPRVVPRNAQGCADCGSCLHGCAHGSKRSTHATWLQDGLDSGNLILVPNAKVERVLTDAGRATGVEARITEREGMEPTPLTVRARAVVVSGGAINTPAILLRSKLKHPMIGRRLCLHPVLLVGGVFPEDYDGDAARNCSTERTDDCDGDDNDGGANKSCSGLTVQAAHATGKEGVVTVKPKAKGEAAVGKGTIGLCTREPGIGRGVMMGVYVQDLMQLDRGYGCVIEAPPAHPGLMGLVLPWNDALSHRLLVSMSRETSVFLCIGRDRSSKDNRVVLGPTGNPVIKYTLGKEDSQVILQGRSEMMRMMRKAGASMLVAAHEGAPWFCPKEGEEGDADFEEYVEAIESLGTTTNEAGVYSAHQMGSCRLSANPQDGPLRETGEAWECDGLFVADASVFPTSIGINPMITVEAVAYMVADHVATRLGKKTEDSPSNRAASSPLRRKIKSFGKAVAAAVSRESSFASDTERVLTRSRSSSYTSSKLAPGGSVRGDVHKGFDSSGAAIARGALPLSPIGVKSKGKRKGKAKGGATGEDMEDDYGVPLRGIDLSW